MSVVIGVLLVASALGCGAYALLAAPVSRIALERRRPPGVAEASSMTALTKALVDLVDRLLRSRGWVPFTAKELELAAVRMTPGYLVVLVGLLAITVFMLAVAVTANVLLALIVCLVVPIGAKVVLRSLASKRRKAFADQLDETIQLLAAALRAGHSLIRGFDSVSKETSPPMSEELARIVNENRIGRDLVEAVSRTAERMQSEDFRWVAEAVGIQRETGGNLNEVLDRVGATIRERNELTREIRTLSAEGRLSAVILMALPVVTVAMLTLVNPEFMHPLYSTKIGAFAFGISAVMLLTGGLWMKAIVNVKV